VKKNLKGKNQVVIWQYFLFLFLLGARGLGGEGVIFLFCFSGSEFSFFKNKIQGGGVFIFLKIFLGFFLGGGFSLWELLPRDFFSILVCFFLSFFCGKFQIFVEIFYFIFVVLLCFVLVGWLLGIKTSFLTLWNQTNCRNGTLLQCFQSSW